MLRLSELKLPLNHPPEALPAAIAARLGVPPHDLVSWSIWKRAHDARRKSAILKVYILDVEVRDEAAVLARLADDVHVAPTPDVAYRPVAVAPRTERLRPVVIGAGPCGLFAGLILAEMGFKPIILDRGKVVRQRTKDTWGLWRSSKLDPESNVQFGEGGAGTFSDGKLYSQIKDPRFLARKVLTEFVAAGAPEEILTEAHPHIGTFRLVTMVEAMREKIEKLGGEYRFEHRVTDIDLDKGVLRGVRLHTGETLEADHVVFAIGHSSRDTFQTLYERGVHIEAKPFSIGFRIEHPQSWIDKAMFGPCAGHPDLGAAAYSLSHHCSNGRTVYSFCMCPGGTVVAATSEPGRVVTNGMSQYSRNERNANSGFVVGISPEDYPSDHPLAGIELQRDLETRAYAAGGGDYFAPGQLVGDFLAGRPSTTLGEVVPSYKPGVRPTDLAPLMPDYVIAAMREALPVFGRKIARYDDAQAVLTGVETRSSSPIRMTRGADFQSLNVRGLFPAGEGAGYAGGILSAAVDGIKVAEAVARSMVAEGTA
ncbi:NAD(P)/FAD-dependent oxidoreductase [Brevundimonas aurantiaca]|uniref:NAD(P)/FAD-dependent oxidoreductase n=1 Tax=Brevundimonas aurantiaca TaxID=74316 RepID=UPI0030175D9B